MPHQIYKTHHDSTPFFWILFLWLLAVLLIFCLNILTDQPVFAAVNQIEEAPGHVLYRSQDRLKDQTGKSWQVVLFKQAITNPVEPAYLRLIGLPGAAEVTHPKPLTLTTGDGQVFSAADVFLEEAPAPTVGQYKVEDLIPQLPAEDVLLGIPQAGDRSIKLLVPQSLVQEWQDVVAKTAE